MLPFLLTQQETVGVRWVMVCDVVLVCEVVCEVVELCKVVCEVLEVCEVVCEEEHLLLPARKLA